MLYLRRLIFVKLLKEEDTKIRGFYYTAHREQLFIHEYYLLLWGVDINLPVTVIVLKGFTLIIQKAHLKIRTPKQVKNTFKSKKIISDLNEDCLEDGKEKKFIYFFYGNNSKRMNT